MSRLLPSFTFFIPLFLLVTILPHWGFSQGSEESDVYFFEMSLDEMDLLPVVTASRKSEKVSEAPATTMVITAQQIKERGYETLEDALRDLPGFDFVHVHGTWPTIWVQRGLYGDENKRTLLMIDGIIENNILEGSVLGGSQYSLHHVEQIEIIWGSASALYGANAFAGIINIITKKGIDIQGITYQRGYGSYQSVTDKFSLGFAEKEYDITLAGSLFSSNGPVFTERHPQYTSSYVDNAFSLIGRFRYKEITVGYSIFDRPMGEGQFSNSPAVEAYGLPPYGFQNNEGTYGGAAQTDVAGEKPSLWHPINQTFFSRYEHVFTNKLALKGLVFYRKTEIAEDSYDFDFREGQFHRDPYHHSSNTAGGEFLADYSFNPNQDVILGVSYEQSNVEKGYRMTRAISETISILEGDEKRVYNIYENYAAFSQYQLKAESFMDSTFTLGLRYDYHNQYGDTINPRISIVSKPMQNLVIKTLFGTAYRAPNNFELFSETPVRIANPSLKPEKATSFGVDIGYSISRNVKCEINLFHNVFDDIIVSNVETTIPIPGQEGQFYKQTQNRGEATVTGGECKCTVVFNKKIYTFINVSYQHGKQNDGGDNYDIPNIAKFTANAGITFSLADALTLFLVENYVGERSTAVTNPVDSIDDYWITNVAISTRKLFQKHVEARITVNNLFDEDYHDPGIRSATGAYYATSHPQPGRSATVQLVFSLSGDRREQ